MAASTLAAALAQLGPAALTVRAGANAHVGLAHSSWDCSPTLPVRKAHSARRRGEGEQQHACFPAVFCIPQGAVAGDADVVKEHGAKAPSASGDESEEEARKKADQYTKTMQQSTGDALQYRHELGMNYAFVLPDLIVGSCLQQPGDVDRLREGAGVGAIVCLQQDSDLAYFSLDLTTIQSRCQERADIQHIRSEIRDFDPFDLRVKLPDAVLAVHEAFERGAGTVYIHCTAGLGRAPALALAYMHWVRGYDLVEANRLLQKVRRCHPKLEAIRAATCDILTDGALEPVTLVWRGTRGTASDVQIAGLNIGWHNKTPLEFIRSENRWVLETNLPVGRYQYKYIVDGRWTYNPDAPLSKPDGQGNVNNVLEVVGDSVQSANWTLRQRLMKEDAVLSEEEKRVVVEKLLQRQRSSEGST